MENTEYADIAVGDIVEFGSRTSEWVVIEHPDNGADYKMIRCIKGYTIGNTGATRLVYSGETKLFLVEPRKF